MIILFLGTVWSWILTEYLRIKRTVFVFIFSFFLLASFLLSFFPLCSLSILTLFLCDKNQRWTMWKRAWFFWLSFWGFSLKKPGEIQKGVALGDLLRGCLCPGSWDRETEEEVDVNYSDAHSRWPTYSNIALTYTSFY